MHEDEIDQSASAAQRHDRWSVLIIGLNGLTQVTTAVANTLEQYTVMIAQHANQKMYDRKFGEIVNGLKNWEKN